MNSNVDRRTFLQTAAASFSAAALPRVNLGTKTADALILLWIPGGMAATETFDPKPCVPFQTGLETQRILTTSPSIETSIPGVRIAAGLEQIAGILNRGTLIRSFVPQDLGALAHARYQQSWLDLSAAAGAQTVTRSLDFAETCREALCAVESGARSVLAPFRFAPFTDWDTHEHGHSRTEVLKRAIDAPVANLILELEHRGRLERTLVVLASEFSRAPDVDGCARIRNISQYGLHAHFTGSASVLLFGGGIESGRVIGRTADVYPAVVVENPIRFDVLRAQIMNDLGKPQ